MGFILKEKAAFVILFIISVIFVFDLFIHQGRPSTFDGPTHLANIAQVHAGLADGDFPVRWGGEFARYGWPAPQFAQQTTSYLGAFLTFITNDIVMSYNLVVLIGIFVSSLLMYIFLRFHIHQMAALIGVIVFHFAPYRIMNVYIRGALPEFFASIFIISILIALYLVLKKESVKGYYLLSISVALLLLTHLFMFIVASFIFVAYGLYLLNRNPKNLLFKIIALGLSIGLGIGLTSYYILPLFMEVKYLYYGGAGGHFVQGHFLTWKNYLTENWYYFFQGDIDVRGNVLQSGVIESAILIISIVYSIQQYIQKKSINMLLVLITIVGLIYIFFTTSLSNILYQTPLGSMQHPWRMLTGFIIIPPIVLSLMIDKLPKKYVSVGIIIVVIAIGALRFPQLYGKNYLLEDQNSYYRTYDNLHGTIMNTIWMGEVRDYPFQETKIKIFEGDGTISDLSVSNTTRSFTLNSESNVKIVDYTFYFPGWKTYVDGKETQIQFQDPKYRGVITYEVPPGRHSITSSFTNTKPRILGNALSIMSLFALGIFIILYPKSQKKFHFPLE